MSTIVCFGYVKRETAQYVAFGYVINLQQCTKPLGTLEVCRVGKNHKSRTTTC